MYTHAQRIVYVISVCMCGLYACDIGKTTMTALVVFTQMLRLSMIYFTKSLHQSLHLRISPRVLHNSAFVSFVFLICHCFVSEDSNFFILVKFVLNIHTKLNYDGLKCVP